MKGSFDVISDTHVDFWVSITSNEMKMKRKLDAFVDSIIPSSPSKVLVIAGDLGHYNHQNVGMLKSLKRYYEYIIFVRGNHDLYLISGKQSAKYDNSSAKRWEEMKRMADEISCVFVLEGTTITLDGITFGGTGMWYDYSYGIKDHGKTRDEMIRLWWDEMNDPRLIKGIPNFTDEAFLLNQIVDESDVIITHVGGDWSQLSKNSHYVRGLTSSFYFFDGEPWMDRIKGKVWCFGHVHDHFDYQKKGCRFINNAIGYPRDNPGVKIKTIYV